MHADFMSRALALAERGRYSTSPNPMVGCVIVAPHGRVLAEGFHRKAGQPHAEVEAMNATSAELRDATMYVTLEPCAHHGRTPPCVDAIVARGIRRVVVATIDPHPLVAGRGIARLREHGIEVSVGEGEEAARALNELFFHSVTNERPFVLLKAGMTLDGKLATAARRSRWITSPESRQRSLELREEFDAILVGGGTVSADDPQLTRRLGRNESIQPWTRVVVDASAEIRPDARIFNDDARTIVFTTNAEHLEAKPHVEIVEWRGVRQFDLDAVLRELHVRGIRSVIAEGGSMLHSHLIERRLWQKMMLFIAPMVIGGTAAPSIFAHEGVLDLTDAFRFRFDAVERVGPDLLLTAYPGT